jgi:uncharacterized Zn finger protein (UPF0148 family)
MSYLHCPTCQCAYNVAKQPACPTCGVSTSTPADPMEAVVAAAEQLARAVARATPVQLAQAQAELAMRDAQKALPSPSQIATAAPSLLRAIRAALAPPPPVEHVVTGRAQQALLTGVVIALLTRIPRPRSNGVRAWATAHVMPRVAAARALLARN